MTIGRTQAATGVALLTAILGTSTLANAQPRRNYWGLEGTVTPKWRVPEWQKIAFDADSVDLAGKEFRIGVVRGRALGGDWGISYVHRTLNDSAAAVVQSDGDVIATTANSLRGVEIHRYAPFGTIRDRVQIGASFGIGAGWLRGEVLQTRPGSAPQTQPAKLLFSPGDVDFPVVPLGRLELAAAAIIGPNLKLKASGGLSFPGQQFVSLSVLYLFAPR